MMAMVPVTLVSALSRGQAVGRYRNSPPARRRRKNI
jgi:hypothetical protein